jgi:hypothetical protein
VLSKGYFAFYPVLAAMKHGLVTFAMHHDPVPPVPLRLRRPGAMERNGTVITWIIEDGERERVTKTLSQEERALPIAAIWNHEMLRIRLREGWRPERSG